MPKKKLSKPSKKMSSKKRVAVSKGRLLNPLAAGLAQSIAVMQVKTAQPELAPCEKCRQLVNKKDFLCHGCGKVICDSCDTNALNVPWGGHSFDAHTTGMEDVEW